MHIGNVMNQWTGEVPISWQSRTSNQAQHEDSASNKGFNKIRWPGYPGVFWATVGTKTTIYFKDPLSQQINHCPPLPYRSIEYSNTLTFDEEKTIYISQHIWKTPDHIPPRRQIILHLYDLWWFDFFALFVGLVLSPAECVSSGNSSDPSWFTENCIMDGPYPVIPNSNR
jgi:hypothetical protein